MDYLTIIAISLTVALGFISLFGWVTLRPGGLMEGIIRHRLESGSSLQASTEKLWDHLKSLKIEIEAAKAEIKTIDTTNATALQTFSNRITSFEAKWGRMSKKEEKAQQRAEIEEMVRNGQTMIG